MISMLYNRYKSWIWLLLALLFATGAYSKGSRGLEGEMLLNAGLGAVCLLVWGFLLIRKPQIREGTDALIQSSSPLPAGRFVALFTLAGAFAAAAMIPYQLQTGLLETAAKTSPLPPAALAAITVVQTAVFCFVACFIGIKLAPKAGLGAPWLAAWLIREQPPKLSGRWIAAAAIGSAIGTLLIFALESFVFQPHMEPAGASPSASIWSAALIVFYGGIVEEVLLRLFLMTLLVWLLSIPLRRNQRPIPPFLYWGAIVLAAVLFGLGHLPATSVMFGPLNALLVIRALVLNGLLGIWFGYLYWKKGLEYAIIAHLLADVFLHVVPRLFI